MDQILDSPLNSNPTFNYAGFWIRVAAYIIDAIILGIAQAVIGFIGFGGYSMMSPNLKLSGVSLLVGVIYFCTMESSAKQGTLGKMAVGIKVGNMDGEQLSFGNALGRYLAKILSALILCIGYMMVGWDDKKQGLHDKLANTIVYYV